MGKGTTSAPVSPARRRCHRVSLGSDSPQATLASGSCLRCASRTASLIWSQILSGEGTVAVRAARLGMARTGTALPSCAQPWHRRVALSRDPAQASRHTQRSPCPCTGLLAWNSRHFPVKLQLQSGQGSGSATYGITDGHQHPRQLLPHHQSPPAPRWVILGAAEPPPALPRGHRGDQRHPRHRRRPWPRPFRPDLGEDGEGGSCGRGSG